MDRGDIERFVELARAGAAVADDRQAEDLLAVAARRPGSADDHAEHLAQVADHGEPSRRRVAMMDIALAGMRRAVGIGQVLAKELIGRGAQQQVGAEVAMQQRQHVAAGPQRHRHADRGGLVARADGDGAFDVSFLEQFQQPLLQTPGEEHEADRRPDRTILAPAAGASAPVRQHPGLHHRAWARFSANRGSIPRQPDHCHPSGRLPRHPCQGCINVMSRVFPIFPPGGPQNGVPDSSVTSSACHGQVAEFRLSIVSSGGGRGKLYVKSTFLTGVVVGDISRIGTKDITGSGLLQVGKNGDLGNLFDMRILGSSGFRCERRRTLAGVPPLGGISPAIPPKGGTPTRSPVQFAPKTGRAEFCQCGEDGTCQGPGWSLR